MSPTAWQRKWVVDLKPVGSGQAALKYLAARLTGEKFVRSFLQHVLPGGFRKVRYCG